MTTILDEANANQAKAINPAASVWVSASAGTGKTKVLTDRVLALLLAGTSPHRLLCLTFTKAAAAEMSNRLLATLADWTIMDQPALAQRLTPLLGGAFPNADQLATARQLFARVLDVPGGMHIETIHAFCQSLLRRFPIEAGLSPHFQVMDDADAQEILADIQMQVLARAQDGSDAELSAALQAVTDRIHESRFGDLLSSLTRHRGQISRMLARHGGVDGCIAALCQKLEIDSADSVESILAAASDDGSFDGDGLRRLMRLMLNGLVSDQESAALMEYWLAHPAQRVAGFSSYVQAFLTQKNEPRKKIPTKAIQTQFDRAQEIFQTETTRLLGVLNRLKAAATRDATHSLLVLGQALLSAYDVRKQRLSTLDYDDLIILTRTLLERPGISPWVLFKLDGGIDHVLIDEAQDTNPDQWAVIRALTTDFFAGQSSRELIRTIFAVGDGKQSIYSFQRADPAEFAAMRRYFAHKVVDAEHRWNDVDLYVSFRSGAAVLDAVNAIFAPGSPARNGVAEREETITHWPARLGQGSMVEVWPLVEMRPADPPPAWKPPIERLRADSPSQRLAHLLAERLHAMIGKQDLSSRGRPIRAGDIMILVRRRGAFVDDLIRALKARHIPVAGADRMVLADQIAVMDLLALGQALLQPLDDLTVAALLKSPLVGLTEDQLFQLAWQRTGSLWDALRAHDAVWSRLTRWQLLAQRLSPYDFYATILGAEKGRQRLSARLGPEADDPLDEFLNLALTFQSSHPPSLQGFLHWLASAGIEIKRDLEQGSLDAVRIMTVHGSKGLQAPIVILPDTMQVPKASTDPLLWLDPHIMVWPPRAQDMDAVSRQRKQDQSEAQLQEYHRLLYVAATRAEDHLIICGWKGRKGSTGNWYQDMADHLNPLSAPHHDSLLETHAETDSAVIHRMASVQTETPDRISHLNVDQDLKTSELPPWSRTTPGSDPIPPRPLSPSRPDTSEPVVRSPLAPRIDGISFQRGTLIHRLLQTLPNLAFSQRSQAGIRYLSQAAPNLSASQQVDLMNEVSEIMDFPGFTHIFQPGSLAEIPVAGLIGSRAIAGVVDRLVVTPQEVIIVDYKTNRRPPIDGDPLPPQYIQQMAAYRLALACIYPHHQIRCALIWTDGPRLIEISAQQMDDALVL